MEIERDFKELLVLLNSHNVEYIVVGGYALAFHGAPRFTGDLDIFVKPDSENATRVIAALSDFGFGSVGLSEDDFTKPNQVVQLGMPPVRIDLITSITAVAWDDALRESVAAVLDEVPVRFISKEHFVVNKRAIGRKKDLADLEALGEE
jgi:predicted nucleotidyltransferase